MRMRTRRGVLGQDMGQACLVESDTDGCSLHVLRVEANERKRPEQLCRHIFRPALSHERVQLNAAGQVELKLKTPWDEGTAHSIMPPGVHAAAQGAGVDAP